VVDCLASVRFIQEERPGLEERRPKQREGSAVVSSVAAVIVEREEVTISFSFACAVAEKRPQEEQSV